MVTLEDERFVVHFEKLEQARSAAPPRERKDAVTGFRRGKRNLEGAVQAGCFDMQALKEEQEEIIDTTSLSSSAQ